MDLKRGDIYYARMIGVGSMQQGIRPFIITSNVRCIENSPTITGVPMTTSDTKHRLPTHVRLQRYGNDSIALCECVTTIDKSLILNKFGECSAKEMLKINIGILIQLGIDIFDLVKQVTFETFNCIRG
jgi:mRNA interferase MazF